MNWYKQAQNEWLDEFKEEERIKRESRGSIVNVERKTELYTFDLYRGFDVKLEELERQGDSYVLSPKKSEQGMLWFTHKFITYYDPLEYARSHGDLLLTYPLQCRKHWEKITYENGETEQRSPEDIKSQENPLENSGFRCFFEYCLELPDGWYWTYKAEKFIGTSNEIVVSPNMISEAVSHELV